MPQSRRVPLSSVRLKRGSAGGPMLRIGKRQTSLLSARHGALMACFLDDTGRVLPYERLSTAMQWRGTAQGFRHCLRQYILQLRSILRKENVQAHFAVAGGVGYALCETAEN